MQTEEVSKLHTTNCVSRIIIHSICQGYKLHRSHQRQNFNPTAMSKLFVAQSDKDSISNQKMGMMSCRLVLGTAIQINENLVLVVKHFLYESMRKCLYPKGSIYSMSNTINQNGFY